MADRVLVTGATGQLGGYVVRELSARGLDLTAWGHSRTGNILGTPIRPVDLSVPWQVASAFRQARPTAVIHAAAMAIPNECARDPNRAQAVNVAGTRQLAELAAAGDCRFVFVSTDLVFDGKKGGYTEADPPAPLSVYGRTKVDAERAVLAFPGHVAVRVSLLFGPSLTDRDSFYTALVAALHGGRRVRLFNDEWRSPLGLAAAARALIEITESDVTGLLHVGGPERLTRLEIGQRLAAYLKADAGVFDSVSRTTADGEPRPKDTALDSSQWRGLFPDTLWPGFEASLLEMGE